MINLIGKTNFLRDVTDLLMSNHKQSDYIKVILPFKVIKRLDLIVRPTMYKFLDVYKKNKSKRPEILESIPNKAADQELHNRSKFDFAKLVKDPNNIAANLRNYLKVFSLSVKGIIDYFNFEVQILKWVILIFVRLLLISIMGKQVILKIYRTKYVLAI